MEDIDFIFEGATKSRPTPHTTTTAHQLVDAIYKVAGEKSLVDFGIYHDEYTGEMRMVDLATKQVFVVGVVL